jgi:hypothetical protein
MNPNCREIIQLQTLASKLKTIGGKFLVTYLKPRNKFDDWSFLKFEMKFELKFMEHKGCWNILNFI